MRQVLAALQGILATLNSLHKAGRFIEILLYDGLHHLGRLSALLGGSARKLRFQLRRELHFHAPRLLKNGAAGKLGPDHTRHGGGRFS
jgi:hypothetical protein